MPRLLFVDTSAWIAAFSPAEPCHEEINEILGEAAAARKGIVTSDYIVDEMLTLIQSRCGHRVARQVGETVWRQGGADVLDIDVPIRETAWALFQKFGDHEVSFTDCTTAALMRLRGIDDILSLDEHFELFGFNRLP